ncbi:hypothetical protein BDA96_02G192100 [Sorghum bicolor]|uniref:Uncharacterized protein n=1 Tax=Sorghum bicolor TaxID=4558 RepID=A0A921RPC7_SORBI|nr:hypothetical protein BDA96_02G192100 [Sorghum bicolor]
MDFINQPTLTKLRQWRPSGPSCVYQWQEEERSWESLLEVCMHRKWLNSRSCASSSDKVCLMGLLK